MAEIWRSIFLTARLRAADDQLSLVANQALSRLSSLSLRLRFFALSSVTGSPFPGVPKDVLVRWIVVRVFYAPFPFTVEELAAWARFVCALTSPLLFGHFRDPKLW